MICISNKFLGAAGAAGLRTTFENHWFHQQSSSKHLSRRLQPAVLTRIGARIRAGLLPDSATNSVILGVSFMGPEPFYK